MAKIWQFIATLLVDRGIVLAKDAFKKAIEYYKSRKKIKGCLDEKDAIKRANCIKDELNDK